MENFSQFLLLRADILQKTVIGCPCILLIIIIANYTSLLIMELNVNEELTCKQQNHSFLKKYTPSITLSITNNFNLVQSSSRLSIHASSCIYGGINTSF